MAALNLAVPSFTITLPSNDRTTQPQPKTLARADYSLQMAPLIDMVQQGQCWELTLASIEFYNATPGGTAVFINVSLVRGTRVGSAVVDLLYRIPGSALTTVGMIHYIPREVGGLFTAAISDLGTARRVEVSLTNAQGNVVSMNGAGAENDTFVTITFRRCG